MSGWSDSGVCPNCDSERYIMSGENRPFEMVSSNCLDCGFYTYTHSGIADLEEVNLQREDFEDWGDEKLKPLKEKRKPTEWATKYMKSYLSKERPDPAILVEYFNDKEENYQVDKYTLDNFVIDFNNKQSGLRSVIDKLATKLRLYTIPGDE